MRGFCFFLLSLVCSLLAMAQQQTYSGRIVDAETGEAMPYTNLYVSSGHGTLTNLNGDYVVLAAPDENVRISFVGYATLNVKASSLKKVMKMQPLATSLNEVEVLGTDALLMKVKDRLQKDYNKNIRRMSHYFCRMTISKGEQHEMVEAFLEAASSVNLRNVGVTNGSYWMRMPYGKSQSALEETNLHVLYSLGPMIKNEQIWNDLVIPFPGNAGISHIHHYYEVSQTSLSGANDRTIYCISLTPKKRKNMMAPIMGGRIYVDAETCQLLMFDGEIYGLATRVVYGNQKEQTDMDLKIHVTYRHKNGYTEVSDISGTVLNEDVDSYFTLVNVEDYHLPFTYGEKIDKNILEAIERAGMNPEVENRYTFIQRTDQEQAIVSAGEEHEENFVELRGPEEGEALLASLENVRDTVGPLAYVKKVMHFGEAYPQEKVYLHLDNTGYFKGETIWFKAYVTRTDIENRTDLSKVLYVELLNPSGEVVARRKLYLGHGEAWGDIKVDSIMVTGFYELRAFTRNMTNWGTQACYSRVLPIFNAPSHPGDYGNPSIARLSYRHRLNDERQTSADVENPNIVSMSDDTEAAQAPKAQSVRGMNVRFYPEGGAWVEGLPANIAFQVTDSEGKAMEVKGHVQDAAGVHLSEISTSREGRGVFSIAAGTRPSSVILLTDEGTERTFELPHPEPVGCAMQVDAVSDGDIHVDIHCSSSLLGTSLGYVMMHGGKIIRCDTLTAASHHALSFKRELLPAGVNQLTLFDGMGRVLSERLFFMIPTRSSEDSIHVTATNEAVSPCGKVTFSVQSVPNATMSFSAVDAAGMVNGNYGNIRTWLLLGSEVRGYIHHPEYYLEVDDTEHRRAADLLMMIQGWRRYDWQLMSGQATLAHREPCEDRLFLYGSVKAGKKKLDVDNVDVTAYFYNKMGQSFNATTTTTELGQYGFLLPNIAGEWTLQLKATKEGVPEKYVVGIDRNFSPAPRYVSVWETRTLPVDERQAFHWAIPEEDSVKWESITKKNILLQNVTVKEKRRFWDRTGWSDETSARHNSLIYYDCDEAADQIADEGEPDPAFCQWLKEKNSLFGGSATVSEPLIGAVHGYAKEIDTAIDTFRIGGTVSHLLIDYNDFIADATRPVEYTTWDIDLPARFVRFYGSGLSYKNRPIVWIVDNQFCTITSFPMKRNGQVSNYLQTRAMMLSVLYNSNPAATNTELPIGLEDVKAVYISENAEALHQYFHCDEVDQQNPVVIYCYTHRRFQQKEKGVRYTHFQGFNTPSTFQMEDYSVVPPMEDFRRTLYWNPNVKLDRRGKATIEFYNNSSCTEMFISAEGMTTDGKPLSTY